MGNHPAQIQEGAQPQPSSSGVIAQPEGGQGPAGEFLKSVDQEKQGQIKTELKKIVPAVQDGSIDLTATSFAIKGNKLYNDIRS